MLFSFIVVCGLHFVPGNIEGCMPVASKLFFKTVEECESSQIQWAQTTEFPEGAFVERAFCIPVDAKA